MVMGEKQPLLGSRRSSRRRSRSIGSLPATLSSCTAPPLSSPSPSTASREGSQANFYLTMLPFLVLQVGLNMPASNNTNTLSSSSSSSSHLPVQTPPYSPRD